MLPPNVVLPSPMLDVDAENVTPDVIALPPTVNIPLNQPEHALQKPCAGRDACLDVADLCSDYLAGYDVLAEPSLARAPCEQACQGGIGEACDNLADMYKEGYGAPHDEDQAATFRKRACNLGDRDACDVKE